MKLWDDIKTILFLILVVLGIICIAPFVILALALLAIVEWIVDIRWKLKRKRA